MKDLDGAAANFERALSLDRNFAESHGGRAVVAALQKRTDVARESASVALRLDPNCLSALYAKAILSGEIKDAASFRQFAEGVLQGQPAPGGGNMRDVLARMQRRVGRAKPLRK
jgi:Tfp pilus assembly protein PilF